MTVGLGMIVGLSLVAVTLGIVCPLSPGPIVMLLRLTIFVPFSSTVVGGIVSSVGGWLIALTVTEKVREKVLTPLLAVPPLSDTVTVMLAVPLWLGAGRRVSVPELSGLL